MSEITVTRDSLVGFYGSWGSGLAVLAFDHAQVYADSGAAGRALINLTDGKAAGGDHSIDNTALAGLDLVYWLDEFGLILGGFTEYSAWEDRGLPALTPGVTTTVDLSPWEK